MIATRTIFKLYKTEKFWVLSDQVVTSGASFITTLLVARQLPIQQFGWYSIVLLAQLLILSVQNALITSPYQVLQANYAGNERKIYLHAGFYLQSFFMIALLLGSTVGYYSKLAVLQPFLPTWWWMVSAVAGYLMQDYLRRMFLADGKAALAFVIDVTTNVLQVPALLFLSINHALYFADVFKIIALTYIPSIVLGVYWLQLKSLYLQSITQAGKLHWQQGKWLLLTAMLQWWSGNIFTVTAGVLLGVEAFGALRLAQNVFGILTILFQSFENYVVPNASRIYRQGTDTLTAYLKNVTAKTGLLLIPGLVLPVLFPKYLMGLIGGSQYVSYAFIIQGMSLLQLFIFLGYPVRIAIRVLSLNRSFFIGYLLTTAFSFLAATPLIKAWNVYGVIAGLILNQLLVLVYWTLILKRTKTSYGNNSYRIG